MISKRIYLVLGGIAILIALAVVAFVFAVKKSKEKPSVSLPEAKTEARLLADEPVISPISSFDGGAVWFFTPKGKLFRVNIDGSGLTEAVLPAVSGTVKKADWPSQGNDFILTASETGGDSRYYYSNADQKYTKLPANIQNFNWLPDSRRIIYIWRSGDNVHQQLNYANADASGYKIITDKIFWPDFKVIPSQDGKSALLIRSKPEGDVNKIYKANLETGEIEIVLGEGKNIDAVWLPNGQKFIFVQDASTVPKLFLYNLITHSQTDLGLSVTLDKVAVDRDGKYAYAATSKADSLGSIFYRLDLASLKQEEFFAPTSELRVRSLGLASDKLFFVSSQDSKLYLIQK